MKELNLLVVNAHGGGKLYANLRKAARRKLEALGAEHVVFGVNRNARGQLSTFFKVFYSDADLEAYDAEVYPTYINAVHR